MCVYIHIYVSLSLYIYIYIYRYTHVIHITIIPGLEGQLMKYVVLAQTTHDDIIVITIAILASGNSCSNHLRNITTGSNNICKTIRES